MKVVYKAEKQSNRTRKIIPIKIGHNQALPLYLNSSNKKLLYIRKLKLLMDQSYDNQKQWDPNFFSSNDYELLKIQRKQRNKLFYYFLSGYIILVISVVCFTFILKNILN